MTTNELRALIDVVTATIDIHHRRLLRLEQSSHATRDTRVDQLADQLAGLQRLVESLVNERGEGRREVDEGATVTIRRLVGECERLVRERQEAINLAESRRVQLSAIVEASDADRDQLRAEVERQRQWIAGLDAGLCDDSIAKQTVVAIADHLERRAQAILAATPDGDEAGVGRTRQRENAEHRAAGLTDAVDALRAGTWKEQP